MCFPVTIGGRPTSLLYTHPDGLLHYEISEEEYEEVSKEMFNNTIPKIIKYLTAPKEEAILMYKPKLPGKYKSIFWSDEMITKAKEIWNGQSSE